MIRVQSFDCIAAARDPVRLCEEMFSEQRRAWEDLLTKVIDVDVRLMCHKELLDISVHELSAAIFAHARGGGHVAMRALAISFWVYACAPDDDGKRAVCAEMCNALTQTVEEIRQKGGGQSTLTLYRDDIARLIQDLSRLGS
jgi:hypothetical protein